MIYLPKWKFWIQLSPNYLLTYRSKHMIRVLIDTLLLRSYNICFGWEIKKLIFNYTLLSGGLIIDLKNYTDNVILKSDQWSQNGSGRVLNLGSRGCRFQPYWRHCIFYLWARHFILCLVLVQPRKNSRHNWKIVDWDVQNQIKQTKHIPWWRTILTHLLDGIFHLWWDDYFLFLVWGWNRTSIPYYSSLRETLLDGYHTPILAHSQLD